MTPEEDALLKRLDSKKCKHGVPGTNFCPECVREFNPLGIDKDKVRGEE